MARRFQSGDSIIFPVPAALQVDGGPLTLLVVAKLNTSAYQAAVYTRSSGAHAWWFEYDTPTGLHANYGTGTTPRNVGTVSTGAWAIHTGRKDNGGSVHPFGRHLTGASFGTDSGDVDSGSTLVDGTAADGSYGLQFGRWGNTGSDYSGDLELAFFAAWTSLVAGATLATLVTEALVLAASPTYWASFEGTSVTDSAGGSPTTTGTTTTSDPSGFFSSGHTAVAGTTTETDAAVALGRLKTRAVTVATETDAAVAFARAKRRTLGVTAETDTPTAFGRVKAKTVGAATSTEAAQALGRSKSKLLGTALETDSALPVVAGGLHLVGRADETDTAGTLGRTKTRTFGTAAALEAALPLARVKTRALGTAAEVDLAVAVAAPTSPDIATRTLLDGPRLRGTRPLDSTRGTPSLRRRR